MAAGHPEREGSGCALTGTARQLQDHIFRRLGLRTSHGDRSVLGKVELRTCSSWRSSALVNKRARIPAISIEQNSSPCSSVSTCTPFQAKPRNLFALTDCTCHGSVHHVATPTDQRHAPASVANEPQHAASTHASLHTWTIHWSHYCIVSNTTQHANENTCSYDLVNLMLRLSLLQTIVRVGPRLVQF